MVKEVMTAEGLRLKNEMLLADCEKHTLLDAL
jgi:hypothetical protein